MCSANALHFIVCFIAKKDSCAYSAAHLRFLPSSFFWAAAKWHCLLANHSELCLFNCSRKKRTTFGCMKTKKSVEISWEKETTSLKHSFTGALVTLVLWILICFKTLMKYFSVRFFWKKERKKERKGWGAASCYSLSLFFHPTMSRKVVCLDLFTLLTCLQSC